MAKSQTNASTGAAQSLINQANTTMPPVIQGIGSQSAQAGATAAENEGAANAGYTGGQTTGFYDPTRTAAIDTALANQTTNLAGMESTGGMNQKVLNQTLGGYSNLAKGGLTPAQQNAIVTQAARGNVSNASNLAAAAQRSAAATGSNAGAAIADIQRTGGQQAADAINAGQVNLQNILTANKTAGLGGLASTNAGLASARQGVAGLQQGVSGQQAGLAGGIASGVNAANAGLAGLYGTAAGQQTALSGQQLQGLGLQFGTEAQGASILQALSQNPGLFQTAFGDVNALLGTLSKFG